MRSMVVKFGSKIFLFKKIENLSLTILYCLLVYLVKKFN